MANGINSQWEKVAGSGQTILATWGSNAQSNSTGFEVNTGTGGAARTT